MSYSEIEFMSNYISKIRHIFVIDAGIHPCFQKTQLELTFPIMKNSAIKQEISLSSPVCCEDRAWHTRTELGFEQPDLGKPNSFKQSCYKPLAIHKIQRFDLECINKKPRSHKSGLMLPNLLLFICSQIFELIFVLSTYHK